jgi:hypothetical protein
LQRISPRTVEVVPKVDEILCAVVVISSKTGDRPKPGVNDGWVCVVHGDVNGTVNAR